MAGCKGFKESLVLSLKDSWTEADLRQLLIIKDQGEGVSYHSRECKGSRDKDNNRVSPFCEIWFHNLSTKNGHGTREHFFKEENEMLQDDRTENSYSDEQPEESSCDKVFDEETNNDELHDVVDRDEESKSCQLRGSKHQAARFAVTQRKSKKHFDKRQKLKSFIVKVKSIVQSNVTPGARRLATTSVSFQAAKKFFPRRELT